MRVGRISKLTCEPSNPVATPEALEAIKHAELIILGPGSLYTSVIPNLLVQGISEAVRQSGARKIYVCNVMTQAGETTDYSVADHVQAVLSHATHPTQSTSRVGRLLNAVLINDQTPIVEQDADSIAKYGKAQPVRYDPEKLRELRSGASSASAGRSTCERASRSCQISKINHALVLPKEAAKATGEATNQSPES